MVNNSTNIHKASNYLSPKESLNCDGQQLPLTLTHSTYDKTTTYNVVNGFLGHIYFVFFFPVFVGFVLLDLKFYVYVL